MPFHWQCHCSLESLYFIEKQADKDYTLECNVMQLFCIFIWTQITKYIKWIIDVLKVNSPVLTGQWKWLTFVPAGNIKKSGLINLSSLWLLFYQLFNICSEKHVWCVILNYNLWFKRTIYHHILSSMFSNLFQILSTSFFLFIKYMCVPLIAYPYVQLCSRMMLLACKI